MAITFHSITLIIFLILLTTAFSSQPDSPQKATSETNNASRSNSPQSNTDAPISQKTVSEKGNINSGDLSFLSNLLSNTYQQLISGQPLNSSSQATIPNK
jgi:hypothetical protein